MQTTKKGISLLILFSLSWCVTFCQQAKELLQKIENYQQLFPKEKLYLMTDKPYYHAGDTLWFKSVLLNEKLERNERSDKIYVELLNDSSRLISIRAIALNNGLGYGDIAFPKNLREGTYLIRAYTNWQQNFGADYFFQKTFSIGNPAQQKWLVESYQKFTQTNGKTILNLSLRLTDLQHRPAGLKDLELVVSQQEKRLTRTNVRSTAEGIIETSFALEELRGDFNVQLTAATNKNDRFSFPLTNQSNDQYDLQFMPEAGHLVNTIPTKVAFKAIGADGLGKSISGKIVDQNQAVKAEFSSNQFGMGSFMLLPQKDEQYTALYTIAGKPYQIALPKAKEQGTSLRIDALAKPDTVLVYIRASAEFSNEQKYQLVAQATDQTTFMVEASLRNGYINLKIPRKQLGEGLVHFTLLSPGLRVLNERKIWLAPAKKITLQVVTDKPTYTNRDAVNLQVSATDENGKPVAGSFAIAVTDDGMVKQNTNATHIGSYFWLESALKGNIESPAWYFEESNAERLTALDHLLLTQGWVGYRWEDVLNSSLKPTFNVEKGNEIKGKLTGLLNKPMPNIKLNLLSVGKNVFFTDTVSNKDGSFLFKDIPYLDSAAFVIKIKNTRDRTSGATIQVDQFSPSRLPAIFRPLSPWYLNTDSTLMSYYRSSQKRFPLTEEQIKQEGIRLREVEIKGDKKEIEFMSKTAWDAKFFKQIDETELKKVPQKTLLDLLYEKIPGFTSLNPVPNYYVGNILISHVMIDKVNTHVVNSGIDDNYNETGNSKTEGDREIFSTNRFIFTTLNASDIKDITIYKGKYYYLDITTRSGNGPWIANTRGLYVHRAIPVYFPKEFYSPKYTPDQNSPQPDLRATIFWNANVVTDEQGKANISFYTADQAGTYTIKLEGTDLQGRFGHQKAKLTINK